MKIGIIREGKNPPDSRVPMTPEQCAYIINKHRLNLVVQSSNVRAYPDSEYKDLNVPIVSSVEDCDVLLGVKEVPIDQLIANKTYFFFSHTIKKQAYNKPLLKSILNKGIRLLDYEVLTNAQKQRVIAFGVYAGMVGAHNALWTWGQRTGQYSLERMKDLKDYKEAKRLYKLIKWPNIKIVLTGSGRVASGSAQVLDDMGIRKVSSNDFLNQNFDTAVYTQIDGNEYAARKDGLKFERQHFFSNPNAYKSIFAPFAQAADIMINGIYWDNKAPAFFTKEEMKEDRFSIQVIADVTCDIAPVSSIPSTLEASTISDPVFGYNPQTEKKTRPYSADVVDMMTIDNLPNEMPRDASHGFGEQFIQNVLPDLLASKWESPLLLNATIAKNGDVGPSFEYLREWVK